MALDYMLIEINEQRSLKKTAEKYNELLMAVEKKHKAETRHETALRYIKECEKTSEENAGSNQPLDADIK